MKQKVSPLPGFFEKDFTEGITDGEGEGGIIMLLYFKEGAHLVGCISFFLLQKVFFFLPRGKVAQFYVFFITEGAQFVFLFPSLRRGCFFPIFFSKSFSLFYGGGAVCVVFFSFPERSAFSLFPPFFTEFYGITKF